MIDPRANIPTFIEQKVRRSTYTRPQLIRRVRVLKDFLSFSLFKHPEGRKNPLPKQIDDYVALQQLSQNADAARFKESDWLGSLGQDFYNQVTPEEASRIFSVLDKLAEETEDVIVYIPKELPEKDLFSVGQWFKQNISQDLVFEARIDPDLIGGCALSYRGIYRDYSLRSTLAASRQVILDNLKALKK